MELICVIKYWYTYDKLENIPADIFGDLNNPSFISIIHNYNNYISMKQFKYISRTFDIIHNKYIYKDIKSIQIKYGREWCLKHNITLNKKVNIIKTFLFFFSYMILNMFSSTLIILPMTLSILYINMFSSMATNNKIGYTVIILVMFYNILVIKNNTINTRENHKLFITEPHDATKSLVISKNKLPKMNEGSEFSYVFWIFINDWEYNYSKPKCIMYNGDKDGNQANLASGYIKGK